MLTALKAAIAPYTLWIKAGAILVAAGAIAWGAWHAYTTVAAQNYSRGYDARVAEEQKAAADTKVETDRRAAAGAQASTTMHAQLAVDIPQIEETTNARTEAIKVIYRDHPVPVCVRPDGVLQRLESARSAANAAASAPAG
jgi:hypothetical protein